MITSEAWKNSALFDSLVSTVQPQMDVHGTAYFISVILSQVPINVTMTFMELNKAKESVISDLTNIHILSGLIFLYSSGQKVNNSASAGLKYRIADIAYIKLSCCVKGKSVDLLIQKSAIYL